MRACVRALPAAAERDSSGFPGVCARHGSVQAGGVDLDGREQERLLMRRGRSREFNRPLFYSSITRSHRCVIKFPKIKMQNQLIREVPALPERCVKVKTAT